MTETTGAVACTARSTLATDGAVGATEPIRIDPRSPFVRVRPQPGRVPGTVSVLIVDDDPEVRNLVAWQLELDGYGVLAAADGGSALTAIANTEIDMVVLDLSLPDMSGLDLLRRIRQISSLPVIIVSGRVGEADRIVGLDLGADDYMNKPFSPSELSFASARRDAPNVASRSDHAGVRQPVHRRLGPPGVRLRPADRVGPQRIRRARFLARSPRKAFTRAQLLQHVWGSTSGWHDEATVTQHVHRVRHKIEVDPAKPAAWA